MNFYFFCLKKIILYAICMIKVWQIYCIYSKDFYGYLQSKMDSVSD